MMTGARELPALTKRLYALGSNPKPTVADVPFVDFNAIGVAHFLSRGSTSTVWDTALAAVTEKELIFDSLLCAGRALVLCTGQSTYLGELISDNADSSTFECKMALDIYTKGR